MSENLAHSLLGRIRERTRTVTVVGDTIVDHYVYGRLETTCQEGCPKFVEDRTITAPGGAANAAWSINRWLGLRVLLYGHLQDECPVKTRYLVEDRIVFRADDDRAPGVSHESIRRAVLENISRSDVVLLSDYDKGMLTPDFIKQVVSICRSHGIPCVADAKRDPEVYRGCILKANEEWQHLRDEKRMPACYVITRGDRPPWGCDRGCAWTLIDSRSPVPLVNHIGAGDCFAAHLALALAYGFGLRDAGMLAHSAGRAYVQHRHNRPPEPSEVVADLDMAVTSYVE